MKTLLITGGLGFIGYSLINKIQNNFIIYCIDNFDLFYDKEIKIRRLDLLNQSKNFYFKEIDITDRKMLKEFFSSTKIDLVIHLASKANVVESNNLKYEYFYNNSIGYFNLLDCMHYSSINKMICASSSSIYGNSSSTPFIDNYENVDFPISIYASTKRQNEILSYTFHATYKIDFILLRFFTVYGPEQRPDLAINKFIHKMKNNEEIEIYGSLDKRRDYTYIDDIVSGIENSINYLMHKTNIFEVINLGSGNPISLRELIRELEINLNVKSKLKIINSPPGDVPTTFSSIEKAKNILNWKPITTFSNGIKKYISWLEKKDG